MILHNKKVLHHTRHCNTTKNNTKQKILQNKRYYATHDTATQETIHTNDTTKHKILQTIYKTQDTTTQTVIRNKIYYIT